VATTPDRWQPEGDLVFIGADGDDMGSHVAKFILSNDIENAKKLSKLIHKGEAAVESFAKKSFGGDFVIAGGDDMLLQAPAARFDSGKVEAMRKLYAKVTGGHTITVGVGNDMVEASKALTTGKNTGKNKTVFWSQSMQPQYEKLIAAKCNDLLTKCRAQGGLSESELLDIANHFYAVHFIERSVDEAIGDVVHAVKKVVHAHHRDVQLKKAKKLGKRSVYRHSLAKDMEKQGFPKLARRMHQHAGSDTAARRKTFGKAKDLHRKSKASKSSDSGMTLKHYYHRARSKMAQRAASKQHGKMAKFRSAAIALRKRRRKIGAKKVGKKSWAAHAKWNKALSRFHHHSARSRPEESYGAMDDFVVQLIQFKKRKKQS
jgi:hypothetical protein